MAEEKRQKENGGGQDGGINLQKLPSVDYATVMVTD